MEGTSENRDPRCLAQADPRRVIGDLVGHIRRIQPNVVVTFDPDGFYGHPDHKAVHRYTREAFLAAGDPARFPETASFAPARLYYAAIPRGAVRRMADVMAEQGIRLEEQGFQPETMGVPDEEITLTVDVGAFVEVKRRAIRSHRTQMAADNPFNVLPPDLLKNFLATEHYIRGEPAPPQDPCRGICFGESRGEGEARRWLNL